MNGVYFLSPGLYVCTSAALSLSERNSCTVFTPVLYTLSGRRSAVIECGTEIIPMDTAGVWTLFIACVYLRALPVSEESWVCVWAWNVNRSPGPRIPALDPRSRFRKRWAQQIGTQFRENVVFLWQVWLVWHAGRGEHFILEDKLLTFLSLRHATRIPGQSQNQGHQVHMESDSSQLTNNRFQYAELLRGEELPRCFLFWQMSKTQRGIYPDAHINSLS